MVLLNGAKSVDVLFQAKRTQEMKDGGGKGDERLETFRHNLGSVFDLRMCFLMITLVDFPKEMENVQFLVQLDLCIKS